MVAMVVLIMVALVMVAFVVPVPMVAFAATLAMVVTIIATVVVAIVLVAPKDHRGIHSALEISTRGGLVQTCIEYYSGIRTG